MWLVALPFPKAWAGPLMSPGCLAGGEPHRVAAVNDELELELDDGRHVTLAGLALPRDGSWPGTVEKALSSWLTGRTVLVRDVSAEPDRWNRVPALVFAAPLHDVNDRLPLPWRGLGKPLPETHTETTLAGAKRIPAIAEAVHAHGGKVIANINFPLAWMVGNVEPYTDALTAGFDTYPSATLDVIFGRFQPVGRLPITLPRGDEVLAVNADGICASPNDVPGYDKDQYIDASLKDENGKAYAYRDAAGNYYELKFGLRY